MTEQMISLELTLGELGALVAWHDYGGVVGEEQERDLISARRKLRDAGPRVAPESITTKLLNDLGDAPLFERRPSHWPRTPSDLDGCGS